MSAPAFSNLRRYWRGFGRHSLMALALVAGLVALRIWDPAPLATLRNVVFDTFQIVRPHESPERNVVIVDVDEKSLAELGQWPWPRTLVSDLVDKVSQAGAAVIAFDIVFAEPDRMSPQRLAATLAPYLPTQPGLAAAAPDSDAILAAALGRSRVVLGQVAHAAAARARQPSTATSIATIGGNPLPHLLGYPSLLTNLPAFEAAAAGRGVVTVRPERDGIIRRVPLVVAVGGMVVPSFALEAMRVATGSRTIVVKQDDAGVRSVVLTGVEIPTDHQGQLWPHFSRHDPGRFLSAADVLAGRVAADGLKGRIVLIGTSAAGLFDLRSTPIERVLPGVELQAQLIEGIIDGSVLTRPNYALGAEIVLAVVSGAAVVAAVPLLGAFATLLMGIGSVAALAALAWWLFVGHAVLLDVTYPILSTGAVFLLLTFRNYFAEEARRANIRNAFGQYLAPELVARLVREPDRLVLGGETRPLTVLFTDFRGFTSLAERFKSNPQGLTALMNRLLTPMSHAVLKSRGTIDKYIGDAIMAFWNAPLDDPDHPAHACVAALDILTALSALEADPEVKALLGPELALPEIGIGIASGVNVVGNMGSDVRFDYTVLGDSVNVASRLQSLTREFGAKVLVSASVVSACHGRFAFLELGPVSLKGRREPEIVSALVGRSEVAATPAFVELQRHFALGQDCHRAGDEAGAVAALERCGDLAAMFGVGAVVAALKQRVGHPL